MNFNLYCQDFTAVRLQSRDHQMVQFLTRHFIKCFINSYKCSFDQSFICCFLKVNKSFHKLDTHFICLSYLLSGTSKELKGKMEEAVRRGVVGEGENTGQGNISRQRKGVKFLMRAWLELLSLSFPHFIFLKFCSVFRIYRKV